MSAANLASSITLENQIKGLVAQLASIDKLTEKFYRFLKKSFSSYKDLRRASEAYSNTRLFLDGTLKGAEQLRSELEKVLHDVDEAHFEAVSERNGGRPRSSVSLRDWNIVDHSPQTAHDRNPLTPIVHILRSLTRFCCEMSSTLQRFEANVKCLLEHPSGDTLDSKTIDLCDRLALDLEKSRMRLDKLLMHLRSHAVEAEIVTPPYPLGWTVLADGNAISALMAGNAADWRELESLKMENEKLKARLDEVEDRQTDMSSTGEEVETLVQRSSSQMRRVSGGRSAFRTWLRSTS